MWGASIGARQRAIVGSLAILAALLAPILIPRQAAAQHDNSRYAAFLQDADTGRVLLAVNADEPRYPASLTKMMTLYLAFEAMQRGRLRAGTRIRVSRHAAGMEPSRLGLRAGSTIRARDAIMAVVTKSANDAAVALGEYLAGDSEPAFARMMTRKARALGMTRTTFRNASGLPHPAQVTTARDMAVLSRALIRKFPDRYAYFSATAFQWRGRTMPNHNRLLSDYDGADGIKTGYIRASGFNLAASAVRDGRRLIAVVFGGATGAERDQQVAALLDRGFAAIGHVAPEGTVIARSGLGIVSSASAAMIAPPARRLGQMRDSRTNAAVSRPRVARPSAATRSRWAVQVGAYSTRASAQAAARRAAARGGRVAVERVRSRRGHLWRARVLGLSSAEARGVCRATRGPCLVLAPRR